MGQISFKKKELDPKVYAIYFNGFANGLTYHVLWMGVAYSFDEAFKNGVQYCAQLYPTSTGWRDVLRVDVTLENINKEVIVLDQRVDTSISEDINQIMKTIIETKDEKLYQKHKKKFDQYAQKFIENNLGNK